MTFISVIIPTYNRADIVAKTIESFLNQSSKDFELIIVDDGSTDNTKSIVAAYDASIVKYFRIDNSERGAARNFGATKAQGEFLNFFDSDDIALPDHIKLAIEEFNNNPQMEAFQFHVANADQNGLVSDISCPKVNRINDLILKGKYCFPNGVFIKREIFAKYLYNEARDLAGTEDWDLYLRMIGDIDVKFFPTVTSYLVQHDGRSVLQFNEKALWLRYEALVQSISNSKSFMNKNANSLVLVKSRMLSYIALHAALGGQKKLARFYLVKAIKMRFLELASRRAVAIIRRSAF